MKQLHRIVRKGQSHWVGDGFPVRTLFSYNDDPAAFSPFLMLDYGGPAVFEVLEALKARHHDLVAGAAMNVGHKTHTAVATLEPRGEGG